MFGLGVLNSSVVSVIENSCNMNVILMSIFPQEKKPRFLFLPAPGGTLREPLGWEEDPGNEGGPDIVQRAMKEH